MKRREFVGKAVSAGAAIAAGASAASAGPAAGPAPAPAPFKLRYAPHFGMFTEHSGRDLVDQLRFMHDEGFTALEDNGMTGRSVEDQRRVAAEMTRLGMAMGVFVAHTIDWNSPGLGAGDAAKREQFLGEIRNAIDVAKRVNAKWMTVVPGRVHERLEMSYQTANVVETLRRACDLLEPHGLVIVLEPLNTLRDHPGQFLTRIPQAYQVCRAVNSPSCKILFDIYHQQITEGNLIPNFNAAWDEVAYVQVGDNPGRREPGTGEINYRNVFRHLHTKGFGGIVGMEHGNSRPGRDGERAVIDAYRAADDF